MSPANFKISIGTLNLWAAKVLFMIGIYWCAKSPDTETTRIRLWSPTGVSDVSRVAGAGCAAEPVSRKFIVALFIYDNAIVSAPAICVVVVVAISVSVVLDINFLNDSRRLFSMSAKGRYLLALERLLASSPSSITVSSP